MFGGKGFPGPSSPILHGPSWASETRQNTAWCFSARATSQNPSGVGGQVLLLLTCSVTLGKSLSLSGLTSLRKELRWCFGAPDSETYWKGLLLMAPSLIYPFIHQICMEACNGGANEGTRWRQAGAATAAVSAACRNRRELACQRN